MPHYLPYDVKLISELQEARQIFQRAQEERLSAAKAIKRARQRAARALKRARESISEDTAIATKIYKQLLAIDNSRSVNEQITKAIQEAVTMLTNDTSLAALVSHAIIRKIAAELPTESQLNICLSSNMAENKELQQLLQAEKSQGREIRTEKNLAQNEIALQGDSGEIRICLPRELKKELTGLLANNDKQIAYN